MRGLKQDAVDDDEKKPEGEFIAWGKDFLPESKEELVTMSQKQLNRMINIAAQEAINSTAQVISQNAANATVKALTEKFDFVPKPNKKPT